MSLALPPRSTRLPVLVPFAVITLIWGSTWTVIRDQIVLVPPSWSVTYRFALAGLAMLVWAAARGDSLRLDARGLRFAAALGLLQFALNFNFVYRAELHITSGLVAVVFALLLVPNALLSRIFLGQKMGRQLLIGSVIAMAGVGLLFLHEVRAAPAGSSEVLTGIGIALTAVLCASSANVLQATRTARDYPMSTLLGAAMLIGAAADAIFSWATAGPPMVDPRPSYFLGLAYLSLIGTALAFSLYFGLIRSIGPAKAAYTSVLIPVIAMIFSSLLEDYRWSPLAGAGAVLAMAGLVLALKARRPNR